MREFSSFRDPSGFVFYEDNILYRQVNQCYKTQFEHFEKSGLYNKLLSDKQVIEHKRVVMETGYPKLFCVIQPEKIPFISYPYEWSFSQLKDAALTTLKIQKSAVEYGMILKDASAYNIQFVNGIPKLIDTLSFDFYKEGDPWVAYGQFCRHFLAPLFLMAEVDVRLWQLMRIHIDGIPIDLASKLLKWKGGFAAKQHIHWHARAIAKHSRDCKTSDKIKAIKISKFSYKAMIDSLINTVERIILKNIKTEWMDYYSNNNYTEESIACKENVIAKFIKEMHIDSIWDFGANDGRFTRIALKYGATFAVDFDIDSMAVEQNYLKVKENKDNVLPLILDLTNPSPGLGFANLERSPIDKRQKPECILALALIHHLAISNNLPFKKIAEWLSKLTDNLIIEFVPKEDSQVRILLTTREDIFPEYNQAGFEEAFKEYFSIIKTESIVGSSRTLYLLKTKRKNKDE